MFVLDTNIVSELRKAKYGRANSGVFDWAKATPDHLMFISALTLMEIQEGILRVQHRGDTQQAALLTQWLEHGVLPSFRGRVLPIDTHVALLCARYHVPDRKCDRDALIAATAQANGMTVVTRNEKDFCETGADILNPWV
ncbi:PIN domain-containing protein [Pseudomonas sp. NPDC007930]|uniref:type II toxin-antitoxin system VapC family toxin n=1 Tax=Pseudomonas sp. NPDC007930 TaxID=3364417 RepID=UPI0036EB22FB